MFDMNNIRSAATFNDEAEPRASSPFRKLTKPEPLTAQKVGHDLSTPLHPAGTAPVPESEHKKHPGQKHLSASKLEPGQNLLKSKLAT